MAAAVPEHDVPALSATDRLVALPPLKLRDARTGGAPRLATSVRLGRRGDDLCVRFDGRDDLDGGIVATHRERDAPLEPHDVPTPRARPHERRDVTDVQAVDAAAVAQRQQVAREHVDPAQPSPRR